MMEKMFSRFAIWLALGLYLYFTPSSFTSNHIPFFLVILGVQWAWHHQKVRLTRRVQASEKSEADIRTKGQGLVYEQIKEAKTEMQREVTDWLDAIRAALHNRDDGKIAALLRGMDKHELAHEYRTVSAQEHEEFLYRSARLSPAVLEKAEQQTRRADAVLTQSITLIQDLSLWLLTADLGCENNRARDLRYRLGELICTTWGRESREWYHYERTCTEHKRSALAEQTA